MLSAITKVARPAATAARAVQAVRFNHSLRDREAAMEKQWVNEEDERLLRNLAKRLRESRTASNTLSAQDKKEREELMKIVGKWNPSERDIAALLEWRHSHEH